MGGRVRARVRVRVSQGCRQFAKGDGRRRGARDETRPRGPETRPVGSQGDPKHAKTLACHGGAPIEWREGPKSPNSRVFGKGKGAGKGAGK